MNQKSIDEIFILPLRWLIKKIYDLNIKIDSFDLNFSDIIKNDWPSDYPTRQRVWSIILSNLSQENEEIIETISKTDPKLHVNVTKDFPHTYTTNSKIVFPVNIHTTVWDVVRFLQPRINQLQKQALLYGYSTFSIFDRNHPYVKEYMYHLSHNYDPYYNIIFENNEMKQKFYRGISTNSWEKLKAKLITKYKNYILNDFQNQLINNYPDLILVNILSFCDEHYDIQVSNVESFVQHMKSHWMYDRYNQIRKIYWKQAAQRIYWDNNEDWIYAYTTIENIFNNTLKLPKEDKQWWENISEEVPFEEIKIE